MAEQNNGKEMLDKLTKSSPVILLINKTDVSKKGDVLKTIEVFTREYDFEAVIPISAATHATPSLPCKRCGYAQRFV